MQLMSAEVESVWISGGLMLGQDGGGCLGDMTGGALSADPWPPRSSHSPWAGAARELFLLLPFVAFISLPFRPPVRTPFGSSHQLHFLPGHCRAAAGEGPALASAVIPTSWC